MDYTELLKLRGDVEKLGKALEGASPPESSLYTKNLLSMTIYAWNALMWFLDRLIAVTIDLREERMDGASAQTSLDLVPQDKAMSVAAIYETITHFLDAQGLEQDDTGRRAEPAEPTAAEPIVEDDPPDGDKVRALVGQVQTERTLLPAEVIDGWPEDDRVAAARWAYAQIDGADAPPPECVSRRYFEDLDLEQVEDRVELLGWTGFTVVADVDWSVELWEEVVGWAMAAHLFDRGAVQTGVPELPRLFLPATELFGQAKALVHQSEGTATIATVIDHFGGHGPGLAVQALLAMGEVSGGAGFTLVTETAELAREPEQLMEIVEQLGARQITVGLSLDGEVTVTSPGSPPMVLVGVDPWRNRHDVYVEKTQELDEIVDNDAIEAEEPEAEEPEAEEPEAEEPPEDEPDEEPN